MIYTIPAWNSFLFQLQQRIKYWAKGGVIFSPAK